MEHVLVVSTGTATMERRFESQAELKAMKTSLAVAMPTADFAEYQKTATWHQERKFRKPKVRGETEVS